MLEGSSLNAFEDFDRHTGINFEGDDLLGVLQELDGEIASTGTNFEDGVGGTNGGTGYHCGD